ncbi:HAD family phosphatase [Candidatus Woesearchaeota archaeon]|nr:HAD family phosphatase [Candidatus Woesearchaeota archaeon]
MKADAIIFDWDGTLADTEPCWSQADKMLLSEYKIKYNDELKSRLTGRSQKECVGIFIEEYGLSITVEEGVRKRLLALRRVYINVGDVLMPGAREVIKEMRERKIKMAIASGSPLGILKEIVKKQGIYNCFEEIISSDEVRKGKPAPDIYIEAAKKLGVKRENCVVIEDAQAGVIAAKEAGMFCLVIPNKYTKDQDFARADKIINSLKEIKSIIVEKNE